MSRELKDWLSSIRVCISHTTSYNPQGNGLFEKYNYVVWRAIKLALISRKLPLSKRQTVLTVVLHSIRSLLCTTINETPHEWLFQFSRRSPSGWTLPTWLTRPGPALLKRQIRNKKWSISGWGGANFCKSTLFDCQTRWRQRDVCVNPSSGSLYLSWEARGETTSSDTTGSDRSSVTPPAFPSDITREIDQLFTGYDV